jgi:hypothetical protein
VATLRSLGTRPLREPLGAASSRAAGRGAVARDDLRGRRLFAAHEGVPHFLEAFVGAPAGRLIRCHRARDTQARRRRRSDHLRGAGEVVSQTQPANLYVVSGQL